jgi:hypothetical protein
MNDDLLAALNRERYSRETATWWTREKPPPTGPEWDDSDLNIRRRRRDLLAAADSLHAEESA